MGFPEHIARAISGDYTLAQDIKSFGEHIDIIIAYIISILGTAGIFILTKFVLFQNFHQNLSDVLQKFDAITQNILAEAIPKNFLEYLITDLWQILAIIIGITAIWLMGTALIHMFSVLLNGRAKFIEILIFTSLLLPLSILFSSLFLILAGAVALKTGFLITFAIILAVALIVILINALIRGVSSIYNYSTANSTAAVVSTILIFIIIIIIIWSLSPMS